MPRITFQSVVSYAKSKGVIVERKGRVYEAWRDGDGSVTAEASTLEEILSDVDDLANQRPA